MRGSAPSGRGRPTPDQELLLEAGTARPEPARAAWKAWQARNRLDDVDPGAQRLLPLVYRHLEDELAEDPDLGRLRGLYRRSWYRNQIVFRWAGQALESLGSVGLETIALKGAALSTLYYRDAGARPVHDVDILVRTEQAEAALDALAAEGWTPVTDVPRRVFLAVRHAEELARGDGARIDLHWNALWQPGRDDDFWDAAADLELHGQWTRALCPSDELLHACVHGAAWNAVPPVRWVADALTVLAQAGEAIDWERLVAQARARQVTYALADALGYLAERFRAVVPAGSLEELRRTRTPLHERVGHRAARSAPSPTRTLCIVWDRYRRLTTLDTPFRPPRNFVAYARETWGFDATAGLAGHATRRLAAHALRPLRRGLEALRRTTVRSSHP